jgi:phosphatidylglycerol:prolipoprotein diacylglycerol transferase
MTSIALGPLTVHLYGFCIALGVIIFMHAIKKNPKFHAMGLQPHFDTMLSLGIVSGILGGRILYCLTHLDQMKTLLDVISLWNGGLSILGAMIGIIGTIFFYLRYYQLPSLAILDVISLYAPLIHAAGRIGCLLAGCCHGALSNGPWAITYHDPESLAVLDVAIHPSQLYSAFAFVLMFVFLYFYAQFRFNKPGQLFALYLILSGLERFLNEFFRYEYQMSNTILSIYQIVGIMIFLSGLALLIKLSLQRQHAFSAIKNKLQR